MTKTDKIIRDLRAIKTTTDIAPSLQKIEEKYNVGIFHEPPSEYHHIDSGRKYHWVEVWFIRKNQWHRCATEMNLSWVH